ncbi:MAG: CheR family methyltransferase [Actinomycetota bacterium]
MAPTEDNDRDFQALLGYLKTARGFDFTGYKPTTLRRRMKRRMGEVETERYVDYVDYLEVHPEEFAKLFDTILINLTGFFRDPEAWDHLAEEIIPSIMAAKEEKEPIRVWTAGCASGEEAYTLAILLAEALTPDQFTRRVKIYATDVDEAALTHARLATYTAKELEPVPPQLREKYFAEVNDHHVFNLVLRRAVIFGRHDLVQDAPISQLDLLVCRNTLIYLNTETQSKVLSRLHFALNDTGFIFLGKAEMLLTHTDLFKPVAIRHRIFAPVPLPNRNVRVPLGEEGILEAGRLTRLVTLREFVFEAAPVAQIVVDRRGNLVLANNQARALLPIKPSNLGRPFKDLEISRKPMDLRTPLNQAYTEHGSVHLMGVKHAHPDGSARELDVEVSLIFDNAGNALGAGIAFLDITRQNQLEAELQRSSQELEAAYEDLQSANEELETSNEELQSSVEELETTNEELQSSNEELETMNEELQSTVEELETTNEELRRRTEELDRANAFLESILTSLSLGVVVVDRKFAIQEWNHRAEDLWGLRSEEVQGRPLLGLDIGLPTQELKEPISRCLGTECDRAEVVVKAINRRGKGISCRIGLGPLMSPNSQERDGVILLMDEVDLTS